MNKSFDCVEMKHKAGRIISRKLSKMTQQQQLKFWQAKHEDLLKLKNGLSVRKKLIKKSNRLK